MFTQLNPPEPVTVLEKVNGFAFAVIDYRLEAEIWCAPNPRVRMQANCTAGRIKDETFHICGEEVVPA